MKMTSRLTGIYSEKDENSIITSCNDVFLEYAGVKSQDSILGRSDEDFPWNDYAEIYRKHELDALSGNNYTTIIPLKSCSGDDLLFMHTKIQKVDSAGNLAGIFCRAVEIINTDAHKLTQHLTKQHSQKKPVYHVGKKLTEHNLSKRQSEILFLLTRGKSPKDIARIFYLSVRTIEYYIDIIRTKLNCRTRWELIDFAIHAGFADELPQSGDYKNLLDIINV